MPQLLINVDSQVWECHIAKPLLQSRQVPYLHPCKIHYRALLEASFVVDVQRDISSAGLTALLVTQSFWQPSIQTVENLVNYH